MHGTVYGADVSNDVSNSFLIYEIDIFLFVASNISNNISIRCIGTGRQVQGPLFCVCKFIDQSGTGGQVQGSLFRVCKFIDQSGTG